MNERTIERTIDRTNERLNERTDRHLQPDAHLSAFSSPRQRFTSPLWRFDRSSAMEMEEMEEEREDEQGEEEEEEERKIARPYAVCLLRHSRQQCNVQRTCELRFEPPNGNRACSSFSMSSSRDHGYHRPMRRLPCFATCSSDRAMGAV